MVWKLAAIWDLFKDFNEKYQENFMLLESLPQLTKCLSFRGSYSFCVYMKSKPAKYGIKIFSIACARTFYTTKIEVYVGK